MTTYFYAYHGPGNENGFDYHTGYGVSQKYKQDRTKVGDLVFIIQKRPNIENYQLCGLFKIVGHYHDSKSARPYRMNLEDYSKLPNYIELDQIDISKRLPQIKGNERWSNFQNHFCRQGVSFQSPLDTDVVSLLHSIIQPLPPTLEEATEDFNRAVNKSLKSPFEEREERLRSANTKPEKSVTTITTYKRNPDVVAAVLIRANGKCEICGCDAPFKRQKDNTPYLEVHHKVRLADDGDDAVENALALCPNCHRKQHFG